LIDSLSAQIDFLDDRIEAIIAAIPAAQPPSESVDSDGVIRAEGLGAVDRLDEITGIGRHAAQSFIAEVG
jgi:hypothetical protein